MSNGRFQFNGKTGWQAANEMCKATYINEPYARAFTNDQITQSILIENYSNNQNYNSSNFWAITSSTINGIAFTNTSAGNNNQNLGENDGTNSRGIRGRISFDYVTLGNGGGVLLPRYFDARSEIAPVQNLPCLCGTYRAAN